LRKLKNVSVERWQVLDLIAVDRGTYRGRLRVEAQTTAKIIRDLTRVAMAEITIGTVLECS
jgi:hypothetical protein